jgi:hypothetical protein
MEACVQGKYERIVAVKQRPTIAEHITETLDSEFLPAVAGSVTGEVLARLLKRISNGDLDTLPGDLWIGEAVFRDLYNRYDLSADDAKMLREHLPSWHRGLDVTINERYRTDGTSLEDLDDVDAHALMAYLRSQPTDQSGLWEVTSRWWSMFLLSHRNNVPDESLAWLGTYQPATWTHVRIVDDWYDTYGVQHDSGNGMEVYDLEEREHWALRRFRTAARTRRQLHEKQQQASALEHPEPQRLRSERRKVYTPTQETIDTSQSLSVIMMHLPGGPDGFTFANRLSTRLVAELGDCTTPESKVAWRTFMALLSSATVTPNRTLDELFDAVKALN